MRSSIALHSCSSIVFDPLADILTVKHKHRVFRFKNSQFLSSLSFSLDNPIDLHLRSKKKSARILARLKSKDYDDEEIPSEESIRAEAERKQKKQELDDFIQLMNEAEDIEERLEKEFEGSPAEKDSEQTAKEKAERLREELVKKAMEQVERRKRAEALFEYGQRAYGSGVYDKSVDIFKAALEESERGSLLGGEIQIWLAMAYDANGQMGDCLALYKALEQQHPVRKIQQQAANLRYITEAPKIKPSKDEMLTIPILDQDNNSTSETWSQMVKRRQPRKAKKVEKDYWETWERPRWERSPFFWVALTIWLTLLGIGLYQ